MFLSLTPLLILYRLIVRIQVLPIALRKGNVPALNFHDCYFYYINVKNAPLIPHWKKVMNEEMKALEKNTKWKFTKLPAGKKVVGCKWVFTIKHKADGSI